jgi:hypothetical protein
VVAWQAWVLGATLSTARKKGKTPPPKKKKEKEKEELVKRCPTSSVTGNASQNHSTLPGWWDGRPGNYRQVSEEVEEPEPSPMAVAVAGGSVKSAPVPQMLKHGVPI